MNVSKRCNAALLSITRRITLTPECPAAQSWMRRTVALLALLLLTACQVELSHHHEDLEMACSPPPPPNLCDSSAGPPREVCSLRVFIQLVEADRKRYYSRECMRWRAAWEGGISAWRR